MQGLTFEYPVWFLGLCALAGLTVALLLYYRDTTFRDQGSWLKILLGGIRWLGYTVLAALLLSPLLQYLEKDQQDPILVLAQDASESIGLGTDTSAFASQWAELASQLGSQYEVVNYRFGDEVRESEGSAVFADKRTNLNSVLAEISDLYANQNLGAVVLASDGIYNEGANPAYSNNPIQAPVYTLGLGDTTQRRDLLVRRVFHNEIAYLNDAFSVQIDLSARNAVGSRSRLTVSRISGSGSTELHREEINIDRNDFFTTKEVVIEATAPGVQRYRISVSPINDELTTANNRRDILVDVLDARQKILLLAHSPHPDISALRQALLEGQNNEIEVAYVRNFTGSVADYDLLVLHQLPSTQYPIEEVLSAANRLNKPSLFVLGEQTDVNRFNAAQSLLSLRVNATASNDVSARVAGDFSLFSLSDDLRQALTRYPPLKAPFGEFTSGPNASTLLRQRIGRVDTEYPLLVLGETNGSRSGVLAATGLWQWRLFDFLENDNHDNYNEFISQLTQYLSIQEDKRRFRVSTAENIFDENEPVYLDAQLYNDSYELINEPEVTIAITDEAGKDYDYVFNRTTNSYSLNAGILPVGNYRFRATTSVGGENLTFNGQFSVQSVDVERYALEADHGLLRLLSDRYGGEFLLPADLTSLPQRLDDRGTVKPILFQTVTTRSVINLKWIFFALLALFSTEWFLRRYYGGY